MSKVIDTPVENYRKVLDTNVIAPAVCAREAVQSMKKRGVDGHIVNISSIAGHYAEMIMTPIGMYAASKYALTALATELRHEIAIDELNVKITVRFYSIYLTKQSIGWSKFLSQLKRIEPK
ncbi:dehydrogenase/reductase SDR family member 11-like [Augochlora pura]